MNRTAACQPAPARLLSALLLAAAAMTLFGCNLPTVPYHAIDEGPMLYNDGSARPVAMYQPAQAVNLAPAAESGPLPWYATRNDYRRSVDSGYRSQIHEYTYTRQREHYRATGSGVRDHGSVTTHTRRYVETVR